MAIEDIDLGTIPLDGTDGDTAREAFTKVNGNFEDLDTRVTALENEPSAGTVSSVNGVLPNSSGNVTLTAADIGAATTAQGFLADSAVQPASLGTAAYLDANDFATNEQGALADTAVQPAELEGYERVLIAGDGITIDRSNPDNPVISSSGGTGTGTVTSVAGVSPSPDGNVPQTDLVNALGINNKVDKVEGKQLSTEDYTNQEKLKLAAIAPQATQNQTDGYLLSRANHTGTQTSSTISDFAATVRNTLLTGLGAGANVVIAATDTLLQALAKLQTQVTTIGEQVKPVVMSGQIGSALYSTGAAAPLKIPFSEFKISSPEITYDSTNRRFYINKTGIYRVSCSAHGIASTNRILIGLNTDAPSTTTNEDNAFGTNNVTIRAEATINITSGSYIVFYFSEGSLYNQATNRFGTFSIGKVG